MHTTLRLAPRVTPKGGHVAGARCRPQLAEVVANRRQVPANDVAVELLVACADFKQPELSIILKGR